MLERSSSTHTDLTLAIVIGLTACQTLFAFPRAKQYPVELYADLSIALQLACPGVSLTIQADNGLTVQVGPS